MDDWMHRLRAHYEETLRRRPEHELLVLFDIDGTILDLRHMILHVLAGYDREHDTSHFEGLRLEDVTVHENQIEALPRLDRLDPEERERVQDWYLKRRWRPEAIFASHRPYEGVMEVIRWLQLQPRTSVGLNTGRLETLRSETLFVLNALGEEWKVEFPSELLFMNPEGWDDRIEDGKVAGVRHFQQQGYHVCAYADNEPANLEAVAAAPDTDDVLLLHADTLFESRADRLPDGAVSGRTYRVGPLASEDRLPRHVRYVWQAVDDRRRLDRFLGSRVKWAELDVRWDARGVAPVVRGESVAARPPEAGERMLMLEEVLPALYGRGRAAKLHLYGGARLAERVVELAQDVGVASDRIAFRVDPDAAGEEAVRGLRRAFPLAQIEAPLAEPAHLLHRPVEARDRLEAWRSLGVGSVSVPHDAPGLSTVLDRLASWELGADVYGASDLEAFLRAALLLPDSVTARFGAGGWGRPRDAERMRSSAGEAVSAA